MNNANLPMSGIPGFPYRIRAKCTKLIKLVRVINTVMKPVVITLAFIFLNNSGVTYVERRTPKKVLRTRIANRLSPCMRSVSSFPSKRRCQIPYSIPAISSHPFIKLQKKR
jgi:hypothetical protein